MAIVAGIAAVAGLAYSAYSNNKKNKSEAKMGAIADQQAQIGADQYSDYQRLYAPREQQMLNDAFDKRRTPAAEAARAAAAATNAGDTAAAIGLRNARKQGINPSSPAYADIQRETQAGRQGLIASAKTIGRRDADEINFNRQNALLADGKGLVTNSVSANNSSFNMLDGLASLRSQRDAATGQLAGQAVGYIGSGLSDYLKKGVPDNGDAALKNWTPFYKAG